MEMPRGGAGPDSKLVGPTLGYRTTVMKVSQKYRFLCFSSGLTVRTVLYQLWIRLQTLSARLLKDPASSFSLLLTLAQLPCPGIFLCAM